MPPPTSGLAIQQRGRLRKEAAAGRSLLLQRCLYGTQSCSLCSALKEVIHLQHRVQNKTNIPHKGQGQQQRASACVLQLTWAGRANDAQRWSAAHLQCPKHGRLVAGGLGRSSSRRYLLLSVRSSRATCTCAYEELRFGPGASGFLAWQASLLEHRGRKRSAAERIKEKKKRKNKIK